MTSNPELNTEVLEVPATVYPGMFERELQATLKIQGQEVTVLVSPSDVIVERVPSDAGIRGKLKIFLVGADERSIVIDLPGEPLGTYRRFRIPKAQFEQAFATPA